MAGTAPAVEREATLAREAAPAWEATLAAALLGADRAPPAGAPLPGLAPEAEPGGALLACVAAQGVLHLAGTGLGPEALVPAPERPSEGPECPPAAASRLSALIAAGASAEARRREWFRLAAEAGLRAPAWLLAELAALRGADAALARSVAGPEIDWLARVCGDAPEADAPGETPAERYVALLLFRQRDPDGARAALEAGFKAEKAKLRAVLLPALEEGLAPGDEPFLEACLDDRAADVRAGAQRLLARLPGSRLAGRMAERARAALAIESRRHLLVRTKHALVVTLPEDSPALARDGVTPGHYERDATGRRAGLLRDILEAAPLSAFADHPPRLWIELALCSEWPIPLFEGFYRSVCGERDPRGGHDPAWVRALVEVLGEACEGRLAGTTRPDVLPEMWARCVALLPAEDWERVVAGQLRGRGADVLPMLGKAPPRLSPAFTEAVLDWLALAARGTEALRDRIGRAWILERFGEAAAPSERAAATAAAILAGLPEEGGGSLRGQVARLADTLALRVALRRDFTDTTGDGRAPPR